MRERRPTTSCRLPSQKTSIDGEDRKGWRAEENGKGNKRNGRKRKSL